ncbi:MAG: phosphotransferase family protein [Acidimicrobiales bacterium]
MTELPTGPVVAWLAQQGILLEQPVKVELIAGGRSNLTYSLSGADERRVVLRRPPFDGVLETAHDMSREWRFISALHPTPVPVPAPLAVASSDGPLGVAFYVMSFVEGSILHDAKAAEALAPAVQAAAAASLVDTMAMLHSCDIDTVGLGDVAKRVDYVGRQLRRWKRQFDQSTSTEIGAVHAGYEKLSRAVPAQARSSIVHGDFRLGNMICGPDGAIRAVLDWELATLGDPLADLGWLLSSWVDAGQWAAMGLGAPADVPPSVLPGFPERQWMAERYQERTGADLSAIDYYTAFAYWRGACISAGVLARYESGVMGEDGYDPSPLRRTIEARAEAALELL